MRRSNANDSSAISNLIFGSPASTTGSDLPKSVNEDVKGEEHNAQAEDEMI